MLKTFIYTNKDFPAQYGPTIVATGTDKTDAVERIQTFLRAKRINIQVNPKDVWQLHDEIPQATFVCGD